MTKTIFTTKIEPAYDDLPEVRYHFPKMYLSVAEQAIGDWIIYYEPRRSTSSLSSSGGRQAYFATAKVEKIIPDERVEGHFYAIMSNYLEFGRAVPFKSGGIYYESKLQRKDGGTNKGAFGRSIRSISESEYVNIVQSGFDDLFAVSEQPKGSLHSGFAEQPAEFERPLVQRVTTRPFRDAAFSKQVKQAYQDTCAITGIKLINGGGRSEVQAAHIRPVAHNGPDSVRNGIALSGTVHWMFDRGLISVDDDYTILTADEYIPDIVKSLFNQDRCLRTPNSLELAPHPQFLRYHRKEFFKG